MPAFPVYAVVFSDHRGISFQWVRIVVDRVDASFAELGSIDDFPILLVGLNKRKHFDNVVYKPTVKAEQLTERINMEIG